MYFPRVTPSIKRGKILLQRFLVATATSKYLKCCSSASVRESVAAWSRWKGASSIALRLCLCNPRIYSLRPFTPALCRHANPCTIPIIDTCSPLSHCGVWWSRQGKPALEQPSVDSRIISAKRTITIGLERVQDRGSFSTCALCPSPTAKRCQPGYEKHERSISSIDRQTDGRADFTTWIFLTDILKGLRSRV